MKDRIKEVDDFLRKCELLVEEDKFDESITFMEHEARSAKSDDDFLLFKKLCCAVQTLATREQSRSERSIEMSRNLFFSDIPYMYKSSLYKLLTSLESKHPGTAIVSDTVGRPVSQNNSDSISILLQDFAYRREPIDFDLLETCYQKYQENTELCSQLMKAYAFTAHKNAPKRINAIYRLHREKVANTFSFDYEFGDALDLYNWLSIKGLSLDEKTNAFKKACLDYAAACQAGKPTEAIENHTSNIISSMEDSLNDEVIDLMEEALTTLFVSGRPLLSAVEVFSENPSGRSIEALEKIKDHCTDDYAFEMIIEAIGSLREQRQGN